MCPHLALVVWMNGCLCRRAYRYDVKWSARVRCIGEDSWEAGQIRNLSVTGVLLQAERHYRVGERVEVEIDFLTRPHAATIVSGVGRVIREGGPTSGSAAIEFIVDERDLTGKSG
jgi:hypothetical protein